MHRTLEQRQCVDRAYRWSSTIDQGSFRHSWLAIRDASAGGLTTCASAAGPHPNARTNERFLCLASRSVTPGWSLGPLWPVGCMRGFGSQGRGLAAPSLRALVRRPQSREKPGSLVRTRNQTLLSAAHQAMPMARHQVVERVSEQSRDEPCHRGETPSTPEVPGHSQSGR
jgi:hypothetical protein